MPDAPRKPTSITPSSDNVLQHKSKEEPGFVPKVELRSEQLFRALILRLNTEGAKYLRSEEGQPILLLKGKRIPINMAPDNNDMHDVLLKVRLSGMTAESKATTVRLIQYAFQKAGKAIERRFSATIENRVYLPLENKNLLEVSVDGVEEIPNGTNKLDLWLDHPLDAGLRLVVDPVNGLKLFESLCVDTQACLLLEMKYLMAMHAVLFPLVRELCINRFIVICQGSSQQGKTTGAQRFTLLHGLGEVKGDYSTAAYGALGDNGLLVMDNKEQANFKQDFIDFCLALATGSQRGRSRTNGTLRISGSRPVAIITSIEGVSKAELDNRCITVVYQAPKEKLGRTWIESEITKNRHEILSALIPVIQRYLSLRFEDRPTPNPIETFQEHFKVLADLLRAYGEVSGRSVEWAEEIIDQWAKAILDRPFIASNLEYPIITQLVKAYGEGTRMIKGFQVVRDGVKGTAYKVHPAYLLSKLKELRLHELTLPDSGSGLASRLKTSRFDIVTLIWKDDKEFGANLNTDKHGQPFAVFIPDDFEHD